MALGPVEHLIIGFPGNRFDGSIAPALARLVESGTVRILDLVFIQKDADGTVSYFEIDELDDAVHFAAGIEGEAGGLLADDDLAAAAEALEPNSSAAFLLWEDCWAAELAEAIRGAGGVIVAGGRVSHELVEQVLAELPAAV
ncbi:MAG: DUF6325 family protein [Acidimicrobiales bacterium]